MKALRKGAAAGLLFVAAPAWAGTSLINGQPLEYNHAYRCKGERIIVAHCRDEDDSSYCQTVYPDRPFVNGMQVAPVEMRGDVVARLSACAQTASAPAQRTPSAPVTSAASGASAAKAGGGMYKTQAPGVGQASWSLLAVTDEMALYFVKARLRRTGTKAEGWFTIVYPELKDLTPAIKDVQFLQNDFTADCAKGNFAIRAGVYFNEDGDLVTGALLDAKPTRPTPGTFGQMEFNVLCGKPQKLFVNKVMDMDALGLVFIYKGFLK